MAQRKASCQESDSLESTIRTLNEATCLPVITLANPDRIRRERQYAEVVADDLFGVSFRYRQIPRHGKTLPSSEGPGINPGTRNPNSPFPICILHFLSIQSYPPDQSRL